VHVNVNVPLPDTRPELFGYIHPLVDSLAYQPVIAMSDASIPRRKPKEGYFYLLRGSVENLPGVRQTDRE
jgi:hypothetical protein